MKAYILESNNVGVESAWRTMDDLLLALKDHIKNHDEDGLSLTVSIGDYQEKDVCIWPVQYCECGDGRKRKLFTNICLVCGKNVFEED